MTNEEVLNAIKRNSPQPGWAVFNYNFKYALSRIAGRFFLLFVFFTASLTFLYSFVTEEKSVFLILASASGLIVLISFFSIMPVILELLHSKNNLIVFTDEGIVKAFKGKTYFFPYDSINNLKFENPYGASTLGIARRGQQFIDFTDKRNNNFVNLAKNRIFGPPENIYSILISKLPLEQKVNSGQTYSNYFNH